MAPARVGTMRYVLFSFLLLTAIVLQPMAAHAQGLQPIGPISGESGLQPVDPFAGTVGGGLISGIINVVNALLVIAGIAAMIYVIVSAVRLISSQGDEQTAVQARQGIIYAVLGIILIILAAVIVNFFIAAML